MLTTSLEITELEEAVLTFSKLIESAGESLRDVFLSPEIPGAKLQNAALNYCNFDRSIERPLMLLDGTVFGSAKLGCLITTKTLYYRVTKSGALFEKANGAVSLGRIESLRLSDTGLEINGSSIGGLSVLHSDRRLVNTFFQLTFTERRGICADDVSRILEPVKYSAFLQKLSEIAEEELPRHFQWELSDERRSDEAIQEVLGKIVFTTYRMLDLAQSWSIELSDFIDTDSFKNYGRVAPAPAQLPQALKSLLALASIAQVVHKATQKDIYTLKITSKKRFAHRIERLTQSQAEELSRKIRQHAKRCQE